MRSRPPAALSRLLAASFFMDGSFYLILTVIPLLAIQLHATPVQLGILPLLSSGVYIGSALFFGRLSDRVSRMAMARVGAWLRVLVSLALTRADSLGWIMAAMPLLGVANALFWPALQASIGEMRGRDLGRDLGAFNVSWSTGKMLGFLLGGVLIARAGFEPALLLSAGLTLLVGFLLPTARPPVPADPDGSPRPEAAAPDRTALAADPPEARKRDAWRGIGWAANFVLFGVGATLNYQYPKLLLAQGFTSRDFGVFLGGIYLFQTVSFYSLRRWTGWHFRLGPLLGAQALALVSILLLGRLDTRALIWATAPGIGLGLGLSYSSSIYYSLFRQSGRGRNTGIHEALLGTGTFLLPLLGGIAAQASGALIAPYYLCGALLLAVMGMEWRWARSAG